MTELPAQLRAAASVIVAALTAVSLSACGSSGTDTTRSQPPPVSAATANHLAKLSDRVASDLDAGETCSAAIAADELKSAVEESDLPRTIRPGVAQVAGDLVNQVNCPPPPPPPPAEKKKPKDKKHGKQTGNGNHGDGQEGGKHGGDGHHGGDHGPKPPGNGKKSPPGHAKLKGEPE